MAAKSKVKIPQLIHQMLDPIETGLERVGTSLKKDLVIGGLQDAKSQVLATQGADHGASGESHSSTEHADQPMSGDLAPGQELNLKGVKSEKSNNKAGNNYHGEIARSSENALSREKYSRSQEVSQALQAVQQELKAQSAGVQQKFAEVAVASTPHDAGVYHVNFFQGLANTIRFDTSDSGAWLNVSKKKSGFQQNTEKHGESFRSQMDRTAATNTG